MNINEFIVKYRDIKVLQDYRGTKMEKQFEDGIMTLSSLVRPVILITPIQKVWRMSTHK